MNAQIGSLAELNDRATDALVREMGIVNTIRFLNQFRKGAGDYTQERDKLFEGLSVKDIVSQIKARRRGDG